MPNSVSNSIYEALAGIRLIDPHTHINPYTPASTTLADLLGYHYYTELAHSSGMPKSHIEEAGIPPDELVRRLVLNLSSIENTAQYRWLIEICRRFFDFDGDRLDASNWEAVYAAAEKKMSLADWPQSVLDQSNVESVFLTNDFDDTLDGFDTDTYVPCLRTDDLVFHLAKSETQQRLQECSQVDLDGSLTGLRAALEQRFEHFVSRGARACAISLPPSFEPTPVADGRAKTALNEILRRGLSADPSNQAAVSRHVFWTLAELCDEFGIPFDLMIGVNRGVYADGVYQGQDLYDSRVSLIQYRELFNAFPDLKFPISVLASVTNQELVSYAWIFPNVITNGHWWYSNTPSFITRDATARLEAVPCTKQIGYYSDAYKLEFVWPKFDMYRRILSNILADHFVIGSQWSEERAIELGRRVLRDNVELIFPKPKSIDRTVADKLRTQRVTTEGTWIESDPSADGDASSFATVRIEDTPANSAETLDPLPSEDEIKAVDLDDVELLTGNAAITDHETLAADVDLEPLDVGDLTGDTDDKGAEKIQMLRGDGSFEADEESLKVKPDPMTGELRFPNPSEKDETELPGTETDEYDTLEDESSQ
ncbi:MAG: glucuronate isomerase [Rubripirellula sp.]|nr:glucuronate isomerase [Rubripirellula sp.]